MRTRIRNFLKKLSEKSIKDEGKENVLQDRPPLTTNKVSKDHRSVPSQRPIRTIKVEPNKSLDSKALESSKPTIEVKEKR